jgi:hypothetical protein
MVLRFLLYDSSDMSIGGVSGERKLLLGGAWPVGKPPEQRRSIAKFCPPPPSGDQSKVLGLEHSWAKNGGKSLPCQECVAVV